jgi:two-component system OmpR family response regulator
VVFDRSALQVQVDYMRILIIEDDAEIAALLASGLEEIRHEATVAGTGKKGFDLAMNQSFDVILLDLMFADIDGFSILQEIREKGNLTPVIIVSARQAVHDKVHCLNAGCDDYLTKPFSFSELVARVNAVVRRKSTEKSAASTLSLCGLEMDLLGRRAFCGGTELDLKPKEFSLLKYLMENAGVTVSRAMIMSNVWGYDFDPGTKILDVHISHLRDKIFGACGIRLIHTVRRCGYVFGKDEET